MALLRKQLFCPVGFCSPLPAPKSEYVNSRTSGNDKDMLVASAAKTLMLLLFGSDEIRRRLPVLQLVSDECCLVTDRREAEIAGRSSLPRDAVLLMSSELSRMFGDWFGSTETCCCRRFLEADDAEPVAVDVLSDARPTTIRSQCFGHVRSHVCV